MQLRLLLFPGLKRRVSLIAIVRIANGSVRRPLLFRLRLESLPNDVGLRLFAGGEDAEHRLA
ncbi:MAG TPA: hypothetical protein VE865_14410, partial [Bradyrhizobium sp.]|nr:hypothetical protein [Bradyrhizobium sp.]